jgi:hypothetical protein
VGGKREEEERRGVGAALLHGEEKGRHRGSGTGGGARPCAARLFPVPCTCSVVFVRKKGKRRERNEKKRRKAREKRKGEKIEFFKFEFF